MNAKQMRELYEREMGTAAAERQDKITEDLDRCTCAASYGNHLPDCKRVAKRLLSGGR